MRARMTLSIIVASLLATAVPAAASKRSTGPTRSQISAAVARVQRSRNLWATVNICNTKRHPDVVGIRGQMPALGFASALSMQVELRYWSDSEKRYRALSNTKQTLALGAERSGLHQSGISFQFTPHAGTLAGTIRFEWRLHRRAIGHIVRHTSADHPDADQGDPAHFSAGKCSIS
jgi:hypothetical protein